jgi:peptide/nickel transport system ATP-binding protein
MYLGRIMEVGETDDVFNGPHHPYTEALLSALPDIDGDERARIPLQGEIPSPADPPSGCVFHPRCHRFIEGVCDVTEPPMLDAGNGHMMRCHIPADQLVELQAKVAQ